MNPSPLRRRLLKGSLAAPAVLTVSSASAQAVSSFGRCLRATNTQPPEFFSREADGWFRKKVDVVRLAKHGHDKGFFYLDPKKGRYVSVSLPYKELDFGHQLENGWQVTGRSTRWALVWFDKSTATQYSRITLQKPSGSVAATMSCYGSFRRIV
jgi:hypothetical protein